MNYGNILSRAWQIVWKHKILWIFGILAGCTQAGSSGGGNSGLRFSSQQEAERFSRLFEEVDPNVWIVLAVVLVLLILLIGAVAIVLSTIGRIGLIRGTLQAEAGADKLIFGELLSGGMPYFWRVLGLNLLAAVALLIGIPLVGVPIAICTCGLGFLALLLFINVFLELANVALVTENLGIFAALGRSWQVIRDHFGPTLVMTLILVLGISLVAGWVIGLPLLLLLGPLVAGAVAQAATGVEAAVPGGVIVAGLCFLAYLPLLLILSGILRAYLTSAWTLTFQRLTAPPALVEAEAIPA